MKQDSPSPWQSHQCNW